MYRIRIVTADLDQALKSVVSRWDLPATTLAKADPSNSYGSLLTVLRELGCVVTSMRDGHLEIDQMPTDPTYREALAGALDAYWQPDVPVPPAVAIAQRTATSAVDAATSTVLSDGPISALPQKAIDDNPSIFREIPPVQFRIGWSSVRIEFKPGETYMVAGLSRLAPGSPVLLYECSSTADIRAICDFADQGAAFVRLYAAPAGLRDFLVSHGISTGDVGLG